MASVLSSRDLSEAICRRRSRTCCSAPSCGGGEGGSREERRDEREERKGKEEGWEGTVKHHLLVYTSAHTHTLHLGLVESLHLLVLFSYERL